MRKYTLGIFSFKKSLSTKDQPNILESLKLYDFFLDFYLTVPQLSLGHLLVGQPHSQGAHNKVGSQSLAEHLVGIELGTCWFWLQYRDLLGYSPLMKDHAVELQWNILNIWAIM